MTFMAVAVCARRREGPPEGKKEVKGRDGMKREEKVRRFESFSDGRAAW